jgi:hypothetical protein
VFIVRSDTRLLILDGDVDYTVQIHEGSGIINVRYLGVGPGAVGQNATIGFQAAGGLAAKTYPISCNGRALDDNSDDADPSDQGWSVAPLR